jgi:hypothetical protein
MFFQVKYISETQPNTVKNTKPNKLFSVKELKARCILYLKIAKYLCG